MKKICFVTSSRADYGTIKILLEEIVKNKKIKSQIIITGSHSSKIFGSDKEIKRDKRFIIRNVRIKSKNINPHSVLNSFSEATKKIGSTLKSLKPDALVVFGDRYEMLASTIAAYILRINIVHIAGGEKTAGSLDEGFRHSISKLSNLHFPVSRVYRKRLIQLGENPKTVFNFGSLNLEKIKKNNYLNKDIIRKKVNIKFFNKNILVTYHPDTIDSEKSLENLKISIL